MFGLSKASEASSTTYSTIDYAIYITGTSIQVYEDSANKGRPSMLSVENVPDPPQALLVLVVVMVLPSSVILTAALLPLSLLGVKSPPVVDLPMAIHNLPRL
jgi:hypothetical protein